MNHSKNFFTYSNLISFYLFNAFLYCKFNNL